MNKVINKVNSLGFLKDEKDTKVVVAMSGGVDSSTVAGLMKKEGYKIIDAVENPELAGPINTIGTI